MGVCISVCMGVHMYRLYTAGVYVYRCKDGQTLSRGWSPGVLRRRERTRSLFRIPRIITGGGGGERGRGGGGKDAP